MSFTRFRYSCVIIIEFDILQLLQNLGENFHWNIYNEYLIYSAEIIHIYVYLKTSPYFNRYSTVD